MTDRNNNILLGGTGPDTVAVSVNEDAWMGNAQFMITLDGVQVGPVQSASVLHSSGDSQTFSFAADLGNSSHSVGVQFLNDAWGGTPDTDLNLYVQSVSVNGNVLPEGAQALYSNGTATWNVPSSTPELVTVGSGSQTIAVVMSEDAWNGDAKFTLNVDGVQVGDTQTATALHGTGSQTFLFKGDWSPGSHSVNISFVNDAWGGTPDTDRNLYVQSVSMNGNLLPEGAQALYSNGTATWNAPSSAPEFVTVGSGSQTITVVTSEDTWNGDAKFTLNVDGVQVGDTQTATALHGTGAQTFLFKGDWSPGNHSVNISFVNDAWGGTASTDRNLYVKSVSLDGQVISSAETAFYVNGTSSFTGSFPTPVPVAVVTPDPVLEPVPVAVVTPDPVLVPVPVAVVTPDPVPVPVVVVAPDPVLVPVVVATVIPVPVPAPVLAPALDVYGASSDVGLTDVTTPDLPVGTRILTVGVDKMFSTISSAVGAAQDGDAIAVDAGTYENDFCKTNSSITMYAVGGRVVMDATVPPPNWKGMITEEANLKVYGFTFNGVRIPDDYGHNGAGIRVDAGNLTLVNCLFTNNQDGILTNSGKGISVTIDHSVFDGNGGNDGNGAGNIHNVYIGDVSSVTATNSVFEDALVGHEFKSRAEKNTLVNNKFISGEGTGTGSYDIDLPNGGKDIIKNNTIIKGAGAENRTMVHFGGESIPYSGSSLTVTGNLFKSDISNAFGISNQTALTAKVTGNQIDGLDYGSQFISGPATLTGNVDPGRVLFADAVLTGVLPGITKTFTDALEHDITLSASLGPIRAVQGGDGHLNIDVNVAHTTVIGGKGGISVTEIEGVTVLPGNANYMYTGVNQYTTLAGSTNSLSLGGGGADTVDSEGNDTIISGVGNQSGVLGGNADVSTSTGTYTWIVNGNATFHTSVGSNFISIGQDTAVATVEGENDFSKVDNNGGTLVMDLTNAGAHLGGSITGGAWSEQTYDGVVHLGTTSGFNGATVKITDGDLSMVSRGADTVYAGPGNTSIQASGGASIYAGTGSLDVYTRGASGVKVYAAAGSVYLGGDTGGLTYYGSDKANTVNVDVANLTLVGGDGLMTVNGGGRANVTGGQGGMVFNENGSGANVVTTVAGSSNIINLGADDYVNSSGTDVIDFEGNCNSGFEIHGNASLRITGGNHDVSISGHAVVDTTASPYDGFSRFTVSAGGSIDLTADTYQFVGQTSAVSNIAFTAANGVVSNASVNGTADISLDPATKVVIQTGDNESNTVSGNNLNVVSNGNGDVVHLGGGDNQVTTNGNGADIWAGTGNVVLLDGYMSNAFTVHGESASISSWIGSASMNFIGGSGDAHFTGIDGSVSLVGGSGYISTDARNYGNNVSSFVGGTGNADLYLSNQGSAITFGAGDAHIHELGWGDAVNYNLTASATGTASIDNFRVGTDHLNLADNVNVVSQDMVGGSAHLMLSTGESLSFTGLSTTQGLFV